MKNKNTQWHTLHAETARVDWKDLERFFAKGNLLRVAKTLDLVDVAFEISNDNSELIEKWLNDEKLATVSDDEATLWATKNPDLWSVVVLPWILVQQKG